MLIEGMLGLPPLDASNVHLLKGYTAFLAFLSLFGPIEHMICKKLSFRHILVAKRANGCWSNGFSGHDFEIWAMSFPGPCLI